MRYFLLFDFGLDFRRGERRPMEHGTPSGVRVHVYLRHRSCSGVLRTTGSQGGCGLAWWHHVLLVRKY